MSDSNQSLAGLTLSVVSHRQGPLVGQLLRDLAPVHRHGAKIVVTLNLPEDESYLQEAPPTTIVIRNRQPLGFGANHNQAFNKTTPVEAFAVVNPDIRLDAVPTLVSLMSTLRKSSAGAVAPAVFAPHGRLEDSARRYPTPGRIASRLWGKLRGRSNSPDYAFVEHVIEVDWAAGMFVLFAKEAFQAVQGFDEKYFMYLEDADICRRLRSRGWRTVIQTTASVVHDAQRASGRSLKHTAWHLKSMLRFFSTAERSV